jgi:glycosyltransferase involved in cell wall biosynthesis
LLNPKIIERLEKYQNITFYPSVKPYEVPSLLAKYDVGIIPYNNLEINKGIYPLKINEYLAVGLPVVMTDFASLKEFSSSVSICNDKKEFSKAIVEAIETDTKHKIHKRVHFAKKNSWNHRANEFGNILQKLWDFKDLEMINKSLL